MDGDGVQQAFCILLWRANGGAVDANGKPQFKSDPVRGICTRAYDCSTCGLMQQELRFQKPFESWWVCPSCASTLKSRRDAKGEHLQLLGFYTEGECQSPACTREGEYKFSILLQLVLGDIREEIG